MHSIIASMNTKNLQIQFLAIVLKGAVVNIWNSLSKTAEYLPRITSESETFPIPLLRRDTDKHAYLCEIVRPFRVYQAAKFLVGQEAYQEEGITLSDTWSKFEPDETIEISRNEEEKDDTVDNNNTDAATEEPE
jgi:hypothetical protein